ncbi:MAG: exodeoxyribonuclease V subunit gamma [Anaerohalosphaeraceae bacterium]|nr:exodeoxyribonuclease V subunit gamma [Anaerohalosphaeraceae bacterium]
MIQFILGKSGTGKTALCTGDIITELAKDRSAATESLIYLLPEQATYQAERAILNDGRISGYSRLSVLSFQRLAFLLSGKNLTGQSLTPSARQMIISRILLENSDKLKLFGASSQKAGTVSAIAKTITELQHYSKSPQDVALLIEKLSADSSAEVSRLKFADINLIYSEYLKFVEGVYIDHDNQLNIARQAVASADFLKGALLWVDGFSGFTTSELRMLSALFRVSSRCRIALCLAPEKINIDYPDADELDVTSLFAPTERTYAELVSTARADKVVIEKPIILNKVFRFEKAPAIGHIEKNIFSQAVFTKLDSHEFLDITAAAKPRGEIEYVASRICKLMREKNYRWRDIAVVASDIEAYKHYINAVFGDYDIPFFLDTRRNLQQYPAVELITSALKIVSGNFTNADIFSYLKSDLVPISRADVDLLENYCLAFGILQTDWLSSSKWKFAAFGDTDFDQSKINAIRCNACDELLTFRASLESNSKMLAADFARAMLNFVERLKVFDTLRQWIAAAHERSDSEQAQAHQQFIGHFTAIIAEFVGIFGDLSMTLDQWASIISTALSQITLALIPPCLDQVLVGSIERSRHPDLKAVFLIGASQKLFPASVSYDSILSQADRLATESLDFQLSDTACRKLVDRRYLAYIAFTRSSEYLSVTYPLTNEKGSLVQPSDFLADLKSLFADFKENTYYGRSSDDKIYCRKALVETLCGSLGKDASESGSEDYQLLLAQMANDKQLSSLASFVTKCCDYDNTAKLDRGFAEKLLGNTYNASATKLDTFAACPYKHFAGHILKLRPRRLFDLKPLDLGQFYHGCLERLFVSLKQNKQSFSSCSDEEIIELLEKAIELLKQEDSFLKSFVERSIHNRSIVEAASKTLCSAVIEIAAVARAGSFEQAAGELAFGRGSQLLAYSVEISGGRKMLIHGKIDRVDIAAIDGKNYALIFDYKTSEKRFSYSMLSAGLSMQLLVYCLALRGNSVEGFENIYPAGAFYLPIQHIPQLVNLSKPTGEKIVRKPKGFFDGDIYKLLDNNIESGNSQFYSFFVSKKDTQPYGHYETRSVLKPDDFESIFVLAESKIKSIAEQIFSGNISARPYRHSSQSPCGYCDYKSLCRFDWQINQYRDIPSVKKSTLLSEQKQGE